MGLYEKYILPRFINLAMQNADMAKLRSEIVPEAEGDVIEVGMGSGLNLPFYSEGVRSVTGIDPSEKLKELAEERINDAPMAVELVTESAEDMPFEDRRFDTAVVTWTLCTIPNPEKTLHELRRVLKPGGALLFVEHGRSPEANVAKWQDRVNPVWKPIGGGCNINRPIDVIVEGNGFTITSMSHPEVKAPKIFAYQYQGRAVLA